MIFDLGPFRFYRVQKNQTLCVSLICLDSWACGWEYGWRDPMRGEEKPVIDLRIGKLKVLSLEVYKGGCEIWFMGFWGMPSWKTSKKRRLK